MSHGYDTVDHYHVDRRLGDDDDFDRLVAAARDRGLRILLDGVFNHVGRAFPRLIQEIEADTTGSAFPPGRWFRRTGGELAVFEGHPGLVAFDHANAEVADYVADVMIHWLRRGADGWRLDAAYAVPPSFWAAVLPRVRAAMPDAYIVAEVIHGDYSAAVGEAGFDSVTQYELWKAMWSAINDGNLFELAWALQRHNGWLESFIPMTFVGNHDVTRIASRIDDPRHVAHALVVLMTTGGTPSIYYGDEQAFRGIKEDRAGGDDEIRPPFPPTPDGPALFSGWETYRIHQELIGFRRRHPWLHSARTDVVHLANCQMVYDAVGDGGSIRVALNLGDASMDVAGYDAGPSTTVAPHGWALLEGPEGSFG